MKLKCLFGHKWERISNERVDLTGTLLPSCGHYAKRAHVPICVGFNQCKCSDCGKIKYKVWYVRSTEEDMQSTRPEEYVLFEYNKKIYRQRPENWYTMEEYSKISGLLRDERRAASKKLFRNCKAYREKDLTDKRK